ncbi:hypothetical protein [Actinoplanes sp. URMC 104]|uniref:hypothetical protein n=1 Tax=Actinoplanes sp. URMC 104 TaxID=3423409 RepID=UPI003F1C7506
MSASKPPLTRSAAITAAVIIGLATPACAVIAVLARPERNSVSVIGVSAAAAALFAFATAMLILRGRPPRTPASPDGE